MSNAGITYPGYIVITSSGVGVASVVYPCDTDTPQLAYENELMPPETLAIDAVVKIAQPEDVAKAILKGVLRKKFRIIIGSGTKLLDLVNSYAAPLLQRYLDGIVRRLQEEKQGK